MTFLAFNIIVRFGFFSGFQKGLAGKYLLNVKGPRLFLVGPYKISGRVLVLPIQGVGKSNITLGNLPEKKMKFDVIVHSIYVIHFFFAVDPDIIMTFDGKSLKRNDKEYLNLENAKLTFKVSR